MNDAVKKSPDNALSHSGAVSSFGSHESADFGINLLNKRGVKTEDKTRDTTLLSVNNHASFKDDKSGEFHNPKSDMQLRKAADGPTMMDEEEDEGVNSLTHFAQENNED
jgi:hypothetical protein